MKNIFDQLENDLKNFIQVNPKLTHLIYDSFLDHKNRYKNDLKLIKKYYKGGKVLDIGASPYHMMYCLKKLNVDVLGVDLNPELLKQFINQHKLVVKKCNIETTRLPFTRNSFDLVIFSEVFEHLRTNPTFVLKEINRVLKPRGVLFLTTPNLYAIHKILMFNLGRGFNDAYDEFNKLDLYGYMGHIREYSTAEMKKFLEKADFSIESISYHNHYNFFGYEGFKGKILLSLAGLVLDVLMKVNPYWRRHQAIVSRK